MTHTHGSEPAAEPDGHERTTGEAVRQRVPGLAHDVWSFCLANAAVVLAAATALIYTIGLIRTMAQLHAEHVQTLRALPLSPLQEYFIAGLAVVLSPSALLLFALVFVLLAAIHAFFAFAATVPEPEPSLAKSLIDDLRKFADGGPSWREIGSTVLLGLSGFLLAALWLLAVPLLYLKLSAVALAVLAPFVFVSPGSTPASRKRQARLATVVAIVMTGSLISAILYLAPPALDRVTIRATNGHYVRAKLLAQTSSMIYLVGRDDHGDAAVTAFPTARIARMEIVHGPKRHDRSLSDVLGLGWLPDIPSLADQALSPGTIGGPIS